jgi:3-oxoadipate enol-lactonase
MYLPGLDGTGRLLHRQTALHDHYQVLCESYPQDHATTYEEMAATAITHLEEAGGRPSVLLAESFGGAVALTLVLTRPDLVERMILVNTFAHFPAPLRIRLAAWLGRFFPDRSSPPSTRRVRGLFFFSPDIPTHERNLWWTRTAGVPMSAFGFRMRMVADVDLRQQLPAIPTPTLVLAAPDDWVVPCSGGVELARLLPRAKLIQPRVGHAALIHPGVQIDRLLTDQRYWPEMAINGRRE